MNKNSLFAVLLRSPWWVSLLVAAGVFALAKSLLSEALAPYGIFASLPFVVIGCVAGWKQLRAPSAEHVAAALEAIRGLSWDEFAAALEAAFRRDGYAVNRLKLPGADFELTKGARVSVVSCKRWKAMHTGIEPLRDAWLLDTHTWEWVELPARGAPGAGARAGHSAVLRRDARALLARDAEGGPQPAVLVFGGAAGSVSRETRNAISHSNPKCTPRDTAIAAGERCTWPPSTWPAIESS
jgi:restriction system protein